MRLPEPCVVTIHHRRVETLATWSIRILLALAAVGCASQPRPLAAPLAEASLGPVRNLDALLSEDPQRAEAIENSVQAFLREASTGEFRDAVVDPAELTKNSFFFRRVGGFAATPGIGAPNILKAYTLNDSDYFVTIAFSGLRDGVPFLDMVVELKATPCGDGTRYRFQCPFEDRTEDFGETTIGDVCFHYRGGFDEARARQFVAKRSELARISGRQPAALDYYVFQSLDEMLKSYGLLFDEARCNFLGHDLGTFDKERTRYVTGMGDACYMYGYASEFLRSSEHERAERYHTMAVGFKTLCGGYWLLGTPMAELKRELRETIRQAPAMDLLGIFKKGRNGQTQGHAPSLVMAALVCEQVLARGDFEDLLRLVYCGSKGERFFAELEAILGVDEAGFGDAIRAMLAE